MTAVVGIISGHSLSIQETSQIRVIWCCISCYFTVSHFKTAVATEGGLERLEPLNFSQREQSPSKNICVRCHQHLVSSTSIGTRELASIARAQETVGSLVFSHAAEASSNLR